MDNLIEKINKVENKIVKTKKQKENLQDIKSQLKLGGTPISNKGRKYKLLEDGSVVVTYGITKKKQQKNNNLNQVVYENIYLFETQYLKTQLKKLKSRLGNLSSFRQL